MENGFLIKQNKLKVYFKGGYIHEYCWKIKELHILSPDGTKIFTPETLPDIEEYEDYAKTATMIFEFTPEGKLLDMMKVPEDMIDAVKEQGMEILDDGYCVLNSSTWKEQDGKFFVDTGIEGEFLGESVDSFAEIKVTEDGCLLHNFDTLLLEKM